MRIQLTLLAVLFLVHFISTQQVPHDVHCNFALRFGNYYCSLDDVNIITETTPLQFFNVHLPGYDDYNVTGLDSVWMWPRNVTIRVVHPQFVQQFPNLQFINLQDSLVEVLVVDSFVNCGQVTQILLNRNRLNSVPPRVFQNCNRLQYLDFTSNFLGQVDRDVFFGLQSLETLLLGRTRILSNTLEHVPNLQRLSLTSLEGIEANALRHLTQLNEIEISDSTLSISEIEAALNGMNNLAGIYLNRNGYTSINFTFFEQFDKLEEFDLFGNELTTIPENSFRNFGNLRGMRLNSNHISHLAVGSFAGLHNLDMLALNQNRLTHLSPNIFSPLISLRSLELSDNIIPHMELETFNGLQSLRSLFINNIQLTNLIPGMFEPLESIERIQIIGGNITSIPPNTFIAFDNLRELHLSSNQITRLNSNSFGRLPLLDSFMISHSVWNQGITEIERNFFDNFPSLTRFGGNGNICFNGVVNMSLIDFAGETEFEQCFLNWEIPETTTTTETTTTPSSGAVGNTIAKLWIFVILIALTFTV